MFSAIFHVVASWQEYRQVWVCFTKFTMLDLAEFAWNVSCRQVVWNVQCWPYKGRRHTLCSASIDENNETHTILHYTLGMRCVPATCETMLKYFPKEHRTTVAEERLLPCPMKTLNASWNFFMFPKRKLPLREKLFESTEVISETSLKELKVIPKSIYEICFKDWKSAGICI